MNRDQLKGRIQQVAGKAKRFTGKLVRARALENKGRLDEIAGKVRAGYGDARATADRYGRTAPGPHA